VFEQQRIKIRKVIKLQIITIFKKAMHFMKWCSAEADGLTFCQNPNTKHDDTPEGFSRCESFVNFAVASTAVVDVALFNCFPSVDCMKTLSNDT
jgi:hypothetical protein